MNTASKANLFKVGTILALGLRSVLILYGQELTVVQRIELLESKLRDVQVTFRDEYPEVKKLKEELAILKRSNTNESAPQPLTNQQQLAEAEARLTSLRQIFQSQYPEIRSLEVRIAELKKLISLQKQ